MAARDVNLRLYIEDGASNWIPAEAGDFVGIKLLGNQTAAGEKTWSDPAVFQSTIEFTDAIASSVSFLNGGVFGFLTPAGGIGLRVSPESVNAGTRAKIPAITSPTTTYFVLQDTELGQQYINDDLGLSGAVDFTNNVSFVGSNFSLDSTSLDNLRTATASHLVNTSTAQTINGNKNFIGEVTLDGSVNLNNTSDFNGGVTFRDEIYFSAGTTFAFDATELADFATNTKSKLMTLGDSQTVTSSKLWNAGQTFQDSVAFGNNFISFSTASSNYITSTFSLDTSSATSLAGELVNDLLDLTSNQSINGYKVFSKVGVNPHASWPDAGMEFLASGDMRFYYDTNSIFEFAPTALDTFVDAVKSDLVTIDDIQDIQAQKSFQAPVTFASITSLAGVTVFDYPAGAVEFYETDFVFDALTKANLVENAGLVDTTTDQIISGSKTFEGTLTTIDTLSAGNAAVGGTLYADFIREVTSNQGVDVDSVICLDGDITACNVVYNVGDQVVAGEKTFSNDMLFTSAAGIGQVGASPAFIIMAGLGLTEGATDTLHLMDDSFTSFANLSVSDLEADGSTQLGGATTVTHGINTPAEENKMVVEEFADASAGSSFGREQVITHTAENDAGDVEKIGSSVVQYNTPVETNSIHKSIAAFSGDSLDSSTYNNSSAFIDQVGIYGRAGGEQTITSAFTVSKKGLYGVAEGDINIATTTLGEHMGAKLVARGTADRNYGAYIEAYGGTKNYGIWVEYGDVHFEDHLDVASDVGVSGALTSNGIATFNEAAVFSSSVTFDNTTFFHTDAGRTNLATFLSSDLVTIDTEQNISASKTFEDHTDFLSGVMITGTGECVNWTITGRGAARNFEVTNRFVISNSNGPTTKTSVGTSGQIVVAISGTSGFLFVCTGTNSWGKVPILDWYA